jgi:hypothetical protein
MKKSYYEQLKHPKWQARRLEVLNRAGFTCEACGDQETTLHVHHILYRKGAAPWEYADHELQALCENCHASWHLMKARLDEIVARVMARIGNGGVERVVGYLQAMLVQEEVGEEPRASCIEVETADELEGVADFFGLHWMDVQGWVEKIDGGYGLDYYELRARDPRRKQHRA